jgi:hypothetical protein
MTVISGIHKVNKTCTLCKQEKPVSEFYLYKDGNKNYVKPRCKLCEFAKHREYNKLPHVKEKKNIKQQIYRDKNRPRIKMYNLVNDLKRHYGMTVSQYEEMAKNHNFKCAICGVPQVELNRKLAVDHCHETGKIRGLLCGNCNTAIGKMKDSTDILRSAISYLEKHSLCPLVL